MMLVVADAPVAVPRRPRRALVWRGVGETRNPDADSSRGI